jgi:hypothetical protein
MNWHKQGVSPSEKSSQQRSNYGSTYVTVFMFEVKETEISFLWPGNDVFWLAVFA